MFESQPLWRVSGVAKWSLSHSAIQHGFAWGRRVLRRSVVVSPPRHRALLRRPPAAHGWVEQHAAATAVVRRLSSNTPPPSVGTGEVDAEPRDIADALRQYIPATFMSLSQIAYAMPLALHERVAAVGGLRAVLMRHPDMFAVRKIGDIFVARCIDRPVAPAFTRCRDGRQAHRPKGSERGTSLAEVGTDAAAPPRALLHWFPTFIVALSALERLVEADDPAAAHEAVRQKLREYAPYLTQLTFYDTADDAVARELAFVSIADQYTSTAKQMLKQAGADPAVHGGDGARPAADVVLAEDEVQPYECLRLARLLPLAGVWYPIDAGLRAAAASLLGSRRCPLHVFLSDPQRFRVASGPLRVQFILGTRCTPPVTHSVEELQSRLADCGRPSTIAQRKQKRRYRLELQYLTAPSPLMDPAVAAQAVFDVLPVSEMAPMGQVLLLLPPALMNCIPTSMRRFLGQFPDLFTLVEGEHELLVQRADLDPPKECDITSITEKDILLSIFMNYTLRRDPRGGTCCCRQLISLPHNIRKRLRQLNFVTDVLQKHPEMVEVLPTVDEKILRSGAPPLLAREFRYVGFWQEELIQRYETRRAKELAARGDVSPHQPHQDPHAVTQLDGPDLRHCTAPPSSSSDLSAGV